MEQLSDALEQAANDSATGPKRELTRNSKYANKRTKEEIEQHRVFIMEKVQQGFTHQEIRDMLEEETGYSLSRPQISYDIKQVREGWREQQFDTFEAYIHEELSWLDMYERKLWQEYRRSANAIERKKIEQVLAELEGESDSGMVTSRITTFVDGQGAGDTKILELIHKARQDRRKILGLYAPSKAVIRTESVKMEKVKGFIEVSPDDWDEEVIEGEYEDYD